MTAREVLHRFASNRIKDLSDSVSVLRNNTLRVPAETRMQAEILKKATRFFVIDRPNLGLDQVGQCAVVRGLFFDLHEMAKSAWLHGDQADRRRLPVLLHDYCDLCTQKVAKAPAGQGSPEGVYGTDEARIARATVDYICTLTDRQALMLSNRISGDVRAGGLLTTSI